MTKLAPEDAALLEAVCRVDVMDAAGKLIANPRRAMVSLAEQLAMAMAIERLQEIAIEADILVRAIQMPTETIAEVAVKEHAIQTQIDRVAALIAAARGETNINKQETYNGNDAG